LGWDYSYYNPENNPFCKNWLTVNQEKANLLIVTEVNRTTPCSVCGKRIGEVSSTFYEIKKQPFCAPCGYKHLPSLAGKEKERHDPPVAII
jgi:hypothetical protein